MFQFDEDIATTEVGPGRYRTEVSPRFNIGDKPNGGYVLACLLEAARREVGDEKPDPLTLTAHYLRPTSVGPADLHVELVRTGRRHAHVEARLVQDTERVRVLAAFGDLAAAGAGADHPASRGAGRPTSHRPTSASAARPNPAAPPRSPTWSSPASRPAPRGWPASAAPRP